MCYKALVFAFLALYFHQGEAIKCYTCTSASDPKCMDQVDTLTPTECTPNIFKEGTALLKDAAEMATGLLGKIGVNAGNINVPDADAAFACVKAVKQDGEKKVVIRSCSVPKNEKFDYCTQLKSQASGLVTFCETCDSDNCNGASGLAPSVAFFLLVAALTTFYARQ